MNTVTAKGSIDNWISQLREFFDKIETFAKPGRWVASRSDIDITEDPLSLGASLTYHAPLLILKRPDASSNEQRVTFEPRHRYTIGAAGQIDVTSYPQLREAMLLRIADTTGADKLTWDEAEERVAEASWKAFSMERIPLKVDIADEESVRLFLEDLVA